MKAVILAAGRGRRINSITSDKPKCLIEVKGKPLIFHVLDSLSIAGIDEIGIVTGYKRELLAFLDIHEFHNACWRETNIFASLCCAREWLAAGTCIISYSDIFYTKSAISSLMQCKDDIAFTYDPNWLNLWSARFDDPLSDAETLKLSSSNAVCEIGKSPSTLEDVTGQYMGLLKITPHGWSQLEKATGLLSAKKLARLDITQALQQLIVQDLLTIRALPYLEEWGEVDSINDLNLYNDTN